MTRLDQNRAASLLAKKAGVPVGAVTSMTIWGNHSDTQYPDYKNARIGGKPATEVITDPSWFTETYIPTVAKRGSAVIKARGASSAASAANAAIDSVRSLHRTHRARRLVQRGGRLRRQLRHPRRPDLQLPAGLARATAHWSIVTGVPIDDDARQRLDASAAELVSERDAVKELLGPAL